MWPLSWLGPLWTMLVIPPGTLRCVFQTRPSKGFLLGFWWKHRAEERENQTKPHRSQNATHPCLVEWRRSCCTQWLFSLSALLSSPDSLQMSWGLSRVREVLSPCQPLHKCMYVCYFAACCWGICFILFCYKIMAWRRCGNILSNYKIEFSCFIKIGGCHGAELLSRFPRILEIL